MKIKYNLEEIKTTYLHYEFQFWAGKRCNVCQEHFTLKNYSQKEIELIFSEFSKVDEHHSSEGVEVKWYHKSCLVNLTKMIEAVFKNQPKPTF